MANSIDISHAIHGATDSICEHLAALTTVTAAAALLAHTAQDSDTWQDAHDRLRFHV